MSTPLLTTKLYVPPLRPEMVPRPRLLQRLDEGLRLGHCLTLISAPAGFGKTTLVAEWVRSLSEAGMANGITWLSLDEDDNDLARFLVYVVAALSKIEASIGKGVLNQLRAYPPPAEEILTFLINVIATLPGQIVVVLDDYHLIGDQAIHDALAFLLARLPRQMHLAIVTREDPHLPLARLRARGQLTELRASDLRFTPSEAAEFLNRVMGLDLLVEDIAALETRTEGWIAGLQLAAISMQGRKDVSGFIKSFAGSHHFVLDYLVEEVLEQQSESVQTFLLQTAILDRLTGSLCDAVRFGGAQSPTRQEDGQTILEMLQHTNLFIVPLDEERRWYRYHHLFADLLRHRLRQAHLEQIPTLHSRAGEWYEENGLPADAVRHALAAQDFERAASLAELAWPDWRWAVQSIAWLEWVKALPEELVRARPVLSVAYAQALLNAGKLEAAEARLLDAERWVETISDRPRDPSTGMVVVDEAQFQSLPVSLATARAYHAQAIGDWPGTVMYTRRALDLLPEEDHSVRGSVTMLLGLAHWANGDLEAAHRTFSAGLASMQKAGHILYAIDAAIVLADMKTVLGQLHEAVRTCEHALQLATEHGEPMPQGTEDVYTEISKLHREQGDLDAAAHDLATSKTLGEQVRLPDWQHRWCIAQARLKETLGDLDSALDLLDEADRLYVRTPLPNVRPIAAMKARVWIKQGRLVEAQSWARERGLSVDDDLRYLREFEHITLARMLIARYENDRVEGSIREAVELLERLLQAAEEGGRTGSVIEILVLQALAHHAQGNIPHAPTVLERALEPLEQALALAEPEGYVRLFVDEGTPMARLLYEALSRGIAPDYVRRLLAAVPVTEPEQAHPATPKTPRTEWVEPLSERELEVLQLIAKGLTNQEIASKLFLSLNTVKVHTRNIYGKLSVHHRAEAVARARALGILPST